MFQNHKLLVQFWRDGDRRCQDHDERAVLLAGVDLPAERLDNLCGLHKAVEVLQH